MNVSSKIFRNINNKKMIRYFLVFISLVLSTELISYLATSLNLLYYNDTPSLYSPINIQRDSRTENSPWGAWHRPNSSFEERNSCFSVSMKFNEVGARDNSFVGIEDNSGYILLGGSFAEGYGINKQNTASDLIEKYTGKQVLNLGSAGDIGPLQHLLIYKNFKHLPHSNVIIFITPTNDLTDNDYHTWINIDKTRYRPYFNVNSKNPLTPYYFPEAIPRNNFYENKTILLKEFIKNNFWSSNLIRSGRKLLNDQSYKVSRITSLFPTNHFFQSTTTQQENFILAYKEILRLAKNANVYLVIIPTERDIKEMQSSKITYYDTIWYQGLQKLSEFRTSKIVRIIDLYKELPANFSELFFKCDDHWNNTGNEWAAKVISKNLE